MRAGRGLGCCLLTCTTDARAGSQEAFWVDVQKQDFLPVVEPCSSRNVFFAFFFFAFRIFFSRVWQIFARDNKNRFLRYRAVLGIALLCFASGMVQWVLAGSS
jgi:hypothetical protein